MRRAVATLTVLAVGWLVSDCSPSGPGAAPPPDGAKLYAGMCALCHGSKGEGYVADNATALANSSFLATVSDSFLNRGIARGRPGTTMSAWDLAHGGPYDEASIKALVAFLRTWQTGPRVAVDSAVVRGDATRGAPIYAALCVSCHGPKGNEGPNVHIGNAELLASASDGFLRYAIANGRPGTPMPSYGGNLTPEDIDDLVALVRGWQTPVATGDVPLPGSLGPIVLNPDGPEPALTQGMRYTPADTIKRELDRGAAIVFLDARGPSDYVTLHVAGATSVPFYEVDQYMAALPKDRWIVAYCGCPHAESGHAADVLLQNGFAKVTVLDEGFFVWRDRGYPVRAGAAP